MSWVVIVCMPMISGLIGWITNYIAIKMLFHPRRPFRLIFTRIQGVFPKRKPILGERLGKIVARDLLSVDSIKEKLDTPENQNQIREAIVAEIEDYLVNKLRPSNPMLGMLLTDNIVKQVKDRMDTQLAAVVPRFTYKLAQKVEDVNIEQMVRDKVIGFSDKKLEDMLMAVISKELRFVEIAGGVLGFLIGLVQLAIVYWVDK